MIGWRKWTFAIALNVIVWLLSAELLCQVLNVMTPRP
jgi:hypothetical protein